MLGAAAWPASASLTHATRPQASTAATLAGFVNANGHVLSGHGFTVTAVGPGDYSISFAAGAFKGSGAGLIVSATIAATHKGGSVVYRAQALPIVVSTHLAGDGSGDVEIAMERVTGGFTPHAFDFVIVQV